MSSVLLFNAREFLSALGDKHTYSARNPYLIFGFLWGLPIPFFSFGLDSPVPDTISMMAFHFFFAVHPILFAIGFGALGTIKMRQDKKIEGHTKELAEANERLKELDVIKKDFLANVSHELRTPLATVLGYTKMMLQGHLGEISERQRSSLAVVLRNTERLKFLIDELLDLAKIEAGKLVLDLKTVPVKELIEPVVEGFKPQIADKQLALATVMEIPDLQVRVDPERIQGVLINLLSNATKFTDSGGSIKIRVGKPRDNRVAIHVKDTGIGIPESFKPDLFERFSQARGSPTENRGGTGLGLAIVKGILDAHGSQIRVESRPNQGTEVTFYLECVNVKEAGHMESSLVSAGAVGS